MQASDPSLGGGEETLYIFLYATTFSIRVIVENICDAAVQNLSTLKLTCSQKNIAGDVRG